MNRFMDRVVLAVGIPAVVGLVLWQTALLLRAGTSVKSKLQEAKALGAQVEQNKIPRMPRDASAHSGRVFAAWEALPPVSEPFETAHFYPDARP